MHQAVAELDVDVEDGNVFVVIPKLIVRTVTMRAEYRTEYSELKPARVKLLVYRVIGRSIVGLPVPSDIGCPIWVAGKREVQTGRHLMAQTPICAVNIARPDGRPNPLLAHESGPGEKEDPLLIRGGPPMLLNSAGVHEGKDVCITCPAAHGELLVAKNRVSHVGPILFGLRAIQPEGVPALGEELAYQVLPIEISCLRVGSVIDMGGRHQKVFAIKVL